MRTYTHTIIQKTLHGYEHTWKMIIVLTHTHMLQNVTGYLTVPEEITHVGLH